MTKIGIIGKGNVGQALEAGLQRAGYEVRTVGKEPSKVAQVAKWSDLVILAVPFAQREAALREMEDGFRDKILVDVTNVIGDDQQPIVDPKRSGSEELQEKAQGAKVVKAFNTIFAKHMKDGQVNGETLTLFVASDEEDARKTVARMGQDIGFDVVDAGPLKNARWLESLGLLNIQLGYGLQMGPDIGFRLIHETPERIQGTAGHDITGAA